MVVHIYACIFCHHMTSYHEICAGRRPLPYSKVHVQVPYGTVPVQYGCTVPYGTLPYVFGPFISPAL